MVSSVFPLSAYQQLLAPTFLDIFGELDIEFLDLMLPRMQAVEIPGGSVLMHQDEPSDAIYFVLSGRLRASRTDPEGVQSVLGEIGRGEPIGEMGVISGEPRVATVTALRDCVLLKLHAADFADVLAASPRTAVQLARKMVRRLTQSHLLPARPNPIVNVCLVPLSEGIDLHDLAQRLRSALLAQCTGPTPDQPGDRARIGLIDRHRVSLELGPQAPDADPDSGEVHQCLLTWLDEQESRHTMQIFTADPGDSTWTRLCLRQADQVLLVADSTDSPGLKPLERDLLMGNPPSIATPQSLWLLHPNDCPMPRGTRHWLEPRQHLHTSGVSHFHTRKTDPGDWARLARILSGRATGLVLAGGGARGLSQLGILQALQEHDIEWDMAGGTSMGAVLSSFAAMNLPVTRIIEQASKIFAHNPTGDINWLPVMSILNGRRLTQAIQHAVAAMAGADAHIEDLWKPYFCVASNYSREQMEVLRRGPLAQALRASASIPAALPPVLRGHDLLIDGAIFNNYPVDIMRAQGAFRVIGVDHSRGNYRPLKLEKMPTPFQVFVDRYLRPRHRRRYKGVPSLSTMVFNATAMASTQHEKRMRGWVDLAFTPDVSRYGLLQWHSFDHIVQAGLRHGREKLATNQIPFPSSAPSPVNRTG